MRDNELTILDQYDIEVKNTRKVRDAYLCESNQGLYLIKEMKFSEKRMTVLEWLGTHLQEQKCEQIDRILRNREGALFSTSDDGAKYFLKKWFFGRECDVQREKDVLDAVTNLTNIHKAMCAPPSEGNPQEETVLPSKDLRQEYFRHNREMKKVRSFIRDKVGKGEFEMAFLQHFDAMYDCAEHALEELKASDYDSLYRESLEEHRMIHGDYNYHNILMTHAGIATTNFEHVQENIQVTDFYYFLRKVMEKNHWDERLGDKMIECYQRQIPFRAGELKYIAICLAYPEKFWKVANSYNRSNKVWIPAKNLEKLELVIRQTEEKKQFLKTIFSLQL